MAAPRIKSGVASRAVFIWDDTAKDYVAWDGVTTSPTTTVSDTPEYFEDTSFVTGDSPATLDINVALGRNATAISIINDGPGNFTYQLSTDGSTFGDAITMKSGEFKSYEDVSVDSVRITWVSNSAYRVEGI